MEYPHISDTKFPDVANVDVYRFKNEFDYSRWSTKVTYKLINVRWNSDCSDVPYFANKSARDAWFDAQNGFVHDLESLFNTTPKTSLKVPLPYNDAYKFNYCMVEMPMQTSDAKPLDYESKNRVSRWFYFVEDVAQLSPNTSELILQLDSWVTFINEVDIPYMMLSRGHAPMREITADAYLSNPIENNEYLLAPDIDFGGISTIKTSDFKPIGAGEKYLCFSLPIEPNQASWDALVSSAYVGDTTPATFYDTQDYWGYQFGVSGYDWAYGGRDFSTAQLQTKNQIGHVQTYAVRASDAPAFLQSLISIAPYAFKSIQAFFILGEDTITRGQTLTFDAVTVYALNPMSEYIEAIRLTKEQFSYPDKYKDLAKLYTFPYSELEITDDAGHTMTARVENTGAIKMHALINCALPFLNYNVFFTGINGNTTSAYVWRDVDASITREMWGDDFSKYMVSWGIPTYALYLDAAQDYLATHFADLAKTRASALVTYKNSVRSIDTSRENTLSSYATATANVARSGETATANVAASGATNTANVAASGATNTSNVAASGATNTANVNRTTSNDVTNAGVENARDVNINAASTNNDELVFSANTEFSETSNELTVHNMNQTQLVDVEMILAGVSSENDKAAVGAVSSVISSALTGNVGGILASAANGIGTAIGMNINSEYAGASQNATVEKTQNAIYQMNETKNANIHMNSVIKDGKIEAKNTTTSETIAARSAITANNKGTQDANASATQATDNSNAAALQATNNSNAAATQATNNANASATQATESSNATWTREAGIRNAQDTLNLAQANSAIDYQLAKIGTPIAIGQNAGDYAPDAYMRRGMRINVRTQPISSIAQTGDYFLRYGYAINRMWDVSGGFNLMEHFTYWQASQVWINDGQGVAGLSTREIENILLRGVTVWSNPDEIGRVSIYENGA